MASREIDQLIDRIEFGILDKNTTLAISKIPSLRGIEIPESYINTEPKKGGLLDPRMGIADNTNTCATCGLGLQDCPGHFGHTFLANPVFHISWLSKVQNILSCVCRCGKLMIDQNKSKVELDHILRTSTKIHRFNKMRILCKKLKNCPRCNEPRPKIKKEEKPSLEIIAEYPSSEKKEGNTEEKLEKSVKDKWSARDCYNILKKISDEECILLGLNPKVSRPENLIIQVLPISPVSVRPSARSDSGIHEDDLTLKVADIVKTNNKIRKMMQTQNFNPQSTSAKSNRDLLQYHIATLIDNETSGIPVATERSGRPIKSLSGRLKHKDGRIRQHLMGKRVDFSARTVITPDPNLGINELSVPLMIATNLTFPEKVTKRNIEKMRKLVNNGRDIYPGANYIIYGNKNLQLKLGHKVDLKYGRDKIDLRIGDTVERHLVDGDIVLFNRQPSLHKYSMMAHYIKVIQDPEILTFRFNVCAVKPYNADFDGDEMNLHVPQSNISAIELGDLAELSKLIVAPGGSKPIIGLNMDPLLASYLITQDDVKINRYDADNILYHTNIDDYKLVYDVKNNVTGKHLFSQIIPRDLYLTRKDKDNLIKVKGGQLTSGLMNKISLGATKGSMNHIIWNKYGPEVSKDFLNNSQRLANDWLLYKGFTVGLRDAITNPKVDNQIQNMVETKRIELSHLLTDIENRLNKLGDELFEKTAHGMLIDLQNQAWKLISKYFEERGDSNFFSMYYSGSKGSAFNLGQIAACVGQQDFEGKRSTKSYAGRSLPYFYYNNDSAKARGFCRNSYLTGLELFEYFFHMVSGRDGIIDTAIKTSDTGYISRKLIKASEDLMVNYDGTVRNANGNIIQYCYAGTGLDATRLEKQSMAFLKLNNQEIKDKYYFNSVDFKIKNSKVDNLYPGQLSDYDEKINKMYLKKIISYRDKFRKIYKKYYFKGSDSLALNDNIYMIPVNITRIIQNILHEREDEQISLPRDLDPGYVLSTLNHLLNDPRLAVIPMNQEEHDDKENYRNILNKSAIYLFKLILHSHLAPKRAIQEYKLSKAEFNRIIKDIFESFRKAIVEPGEMVGILSAQSIGEPSTQLTLNSFHSTGISGKGVSIGSSGIPRLKELLSLTSNMKKSVMTIYLDSKYSQSKQEMLKVKYYIEEIYLENLAVQVDIYFDPNNEYLHQDNVSNIYYVNQNIANRCKDTIENMPWLIRIELNRTELMQKGITLLDIRSRFCTFWSDKQTNPTKEEKNILSKITQCAILSNYDNSEIPTLHIRLEMLPFHHYDVIEFQKIILEKFKIRGIDGVKQTEDDEINQIKFSDDGNIIKGKEHIIYAFGSNLNEIVKIRGIDFNRVIPNDIIHTYEILGLEATRALLIREFRTIFEDVSYHHLTILVDIICNQGYLTSIDRHGINRLETDPLSRASFEETTDMLFQAAVFSEVDSMKSVSSRIMAGQRILGGTGIFDVLLDSKMVEEMEHEEFDIDEDIADSLLENILMIETLREKNTNIFKPKSS